MLIKTAVDNPSCDEETHDSISVEHQPPLGRRAGMLVVIVVAALAGGGLWWQHAATADPGLSFDGGPKVFRNTEAGDITGIELVGTTFGTDVNVEFQPGAALHGFFGLYNRGPRTVTIEAIPRRGLYYWALDGVAVSNNWRTAVEGQNYVPFRPFRLRSGETRYVRLDFHTATCDPSGLQEGSSRIVSLPVRYRILGVTRTATVPFDQVSIAIQTAGTCDHPL